MKKISFLEIYHKLITALLVITCFLFCSPWVTLAADSQSQTGKTVRIGVFGLRSFVDKNPAGEYFGYGVDYLNQICMYTGWKYELVVTDNVSLRTMLANGQLDFLMPIEYSKDRLDSYLYPNYPMGSQFNGLYVLMNRRDIYYEDYASFNNMKIGVVENTFPAESMRAFAKAHDFVYQEVLYANLQELHDAVRMGQVEAACLSALGNIPTNYKLVARTELMPFYIVADAKHPSPYFAELGVAINNLNVNLPFLAVQLHDTYLKSYDFNKDRAFSREELAYLERHPVIHVMGASDRYPVVFQDPKTGDLDGILKGLLDLITVKTGVQFKYSVNKPNFNIQEGLKNPDVDMVVGLIRTANFRQDENMILSNGILNNTIGIVGRKGRPFDINKGYAVAIPRSAIGTNAHFKAYHPNYKVVNYEPLEECLRAVLRGEVDGAVQNADILAATLQHPEFSDLTLWHTFRGEGEYSYCLAIRATDNPLLLSIINKGIASLDQNDIEAIRIKYASAAQYEMTLRDAMAKYGPAIVIVVVLLGIIVAGLVYIFRTKEKNIEKLSVAMEESKKANSAKSEFLSRMSHDMRTPLNVIIGMTYLAREQKLLPVVADYLAKIDRSSKFLLSLINDILDMSKVESNKIEFHAEPYPPEEFKAYMDAVIQPLVETKNQKLLIKVDIAPGYVPVMDKLRTNQIVFNLLSNAIKYTPEGGTITYTAIGKLQPDGKMHIHIEVKDNGIGMSEAFQEVLFDPFTQERQSDVASNRGTGLGMAITKRLVTLLQGTIAVQSKLNEGSIFFVDFTVKTLKEQTVKAAKLEKQNETVKEDILEGKHILLCEDHPLNQEIGKTLLEKKGAQVVIAENGQQGLELFKTSVPYFYDAVLMDIRMPVMNGYAATAALRKLDREDAATVPIIAMTADAFADDVQKCKAAGMNDHIAKPINPKVMFTTIAKYLH